MQSCLLCTVNYGLCCLPTCRECTSCWHHACANHVSNADCILVVTSGTPGYWRTLEEVEAEASDPVGRNAPSPWVSPFALPCQFFLFLRCCFEMLPLTPCLLVFICPCLTRWCHSSEAVCRTCRTFCLCVSLLYTAIHVRHVIASWCWCCVCGAVPDMKQCKVFLVAGC